MAKQQRARSLVERPQPRDGIPTGKSRDRITVQNLSAAGLIALAQKKLGPEHVNDVLAAWDFITDERGKTYEVRSWKPGREVSSDEVREHFTDGFVGNTAAFVALVMRNDPKGNHMTIPEDARFFRDDDDVGAPFFYHLGNLRELELHLEIRDVWIGDLRFWAFREIQT